MSLLDEFRSFVSEALDTIRENPVFNAAAKMAIKRIPVAGELLLDIYESSRSSDDRKLAGLEQVLERFAQFEQRDVEELRPRLSSILEDTRRNGRALETLLEVSAELVRRLGGLSLDLDRNHSEILRLREELTRQSERLIRFDAGLLGDQLFFFVHLRRLLAPTKEIFDTQLRLADLILAGVPGAPSGQGLDDDLRLLHSRIPPERKTALRALRRQTDDMQQIHVRVWQLLAQNRAFFDSLPELETLHDHISMWLAKYELLRTDGHMCLVFAGAAQGKPFPAGIELRIDARISALRDQAHLE